MSKVTESVSLYCDAKLNSENSARRVRTVLADWLAFIGSESRLYDAAEFDCHRYVAALKKRPGQRSRYNRTDTKLSSKTIKNSIDILRSFYDFLFQIKEINLNPWRAISFTLDQPDPKRETESLDWRIAERMIELPSEHSREGLRDKVILILLFGCGLREGEVRDLRLESFRSTPQGTLFCHIVRGKSRGRKVAIPDRYAPLIEKLMAIRAHESSSLSGYLITTYKRLRATNKPLASKTLYNRFKKYAAEAGAPDTISPHSGRRTFVNQLDLEGVPLNQIRTATGHASLSSLQAYLDRNANIDEAPNKMLGAKKN